MKGLVDFAFQRVRVVLTLLFVSILFGVIAYMTIPRESDPDIPIPFVMVSIYLNGISPEDGERLLARPAELELKSIECLKQMDSFAYLGTVQILLEFETTCDVDQAVIDVREKVDAAKAKFPADAEEPVVSEFNAQTQFPIISVIVSGDAPEREIYRAARRLKDRLEGVSGVLEANLVGDREELLEIVVAPEILDTYNVTQSDIAAAVINNNQLVAAGRIDTGDGRFSVKIPGTFESLRDVMRLPVKVNPETGGVVTFADVADVRRTFMDADGFAYYNGRPAIAVDVTKRAGSNIIEVIEEVRAETAAEAENWPATLSYDFASDQSTYIADILSTLTSSIVTAILLVMIIVVAALGLRSATMVGIAIPTSFLIGFSLLSFSGMTLNMMVMFAMVLAVGMLVDGAIVIVELADRRMQEGMARGEAYLDAAKRMFWPIISSTGTTLAAFVPFLFWNDITGEYMKFLPLTLIYILTASLFVALIFLPVTATVLGDGIDRAGLLLARAYRAARGRIAGARTRSPAGENPEARPASDAEAPHSAAAELEQSDPLVLGGFYGAYARALNALIRRPFLVLAAAGIALWSILIVFDRAAPNVEYFIETDPDQIYVLVQARGNLSAQERLALVLDVEERLHDVEGVKGLYTSTGNDFGRDGTTPADTIGRVFVELLPYAERRSGREIMREIEWLVRDVPGVRVEVSEPPAGPPVGKDIQLELTAANYDELLAATYKARDFLRDARTDLNGAMVHAYTDIDETAPLPGVEWNLSVDREQAGRFGVDIGQIGAMVQLVTNGLLLDKYRPDDADDEIDIRVRYPEYAREITNLDLLRVRTNRGLVPISNFVTREPVPSVDRITRRDGARIMEVRANANSFADGTAIGQDKAIAQLREWLETGALGEGVRWRMRGADEETQAAAQFFAMAMLSALFMMAIILLMQFNSFYHALLTLSAVVLSVFGVLLGVALTGQYISVIMTGTGVVALAGIVVNNNIVLIDTFQHERRAGFGVTEAVLRTAVQRLRPVMLTTITTICGLLPMVFELNVNFAAGAISQGSQTSIWWVLLSSAVVFGLGFSTLLTLVLTPVLLAAPAYVPQNVMAGLRFLWRLARRIWDAVSGGGARGGRSGRPSGGPAPQPAE
ncbi:MAG: multidrug efflux RND transporter permease subunit VmeK [Parvularculaceae bacterium]